MLHPFHIISNSPWPLLTSISSLALGTSVLSAIKGSTNYGSILLLFSLVCTLLTVSLWIRDISRESKLFGFRSSITILALKEGYLLFILSELMIFLSLFASYMNFGLTYTYDWPPYDLGISIYGIPLLNTALLLTSGATITLFHHKLIGCDYSNYRPRPVVSIKDDINNSPNRLNIIKLLGNSILANRGLDLTLIEELPTKPKPNLPIEEDTEEAYLRSINRSRLQVITYLTLTIVLGLTFTSLQIFEYATAHFSISDGVFGSIFYSTTGLHGLHVIIGLIFFIVSLGRLVTYNQTTNDHWGTEASIIYWHFVDYVWLVVYLLFYVWSN